MDQAGLPYPKDLGSKWNWDQALLTGKKTTRDTNGDGIPDIWGLDRMAGPPHRYMWIHQAGGRLYDTTIAPTKSLWNTPEVAKGLSFPLRAIMDRITPSPSTPNQAQTYFWTGMNAVSLVDGPGVIGAYLKEASFRWNIAQQVIGPVNGGSEITVNAFQMVNASPHKEQAWRWLRFISLDVDSHTRFVEYTGRAPSLALLQRRYQQLNRFVPSNYMAFFEVAGNPSTQMNYIIPQQPRINTVAGPVLTQIWNGELPLETALAQIHNLVTPILQNR